MILRENVQRRIVVSCNVAGRDLGSVVEDIQAAVARAGADAGRLSRRVRRAVREPAERDANGCWSSASRRSPALFMLLVLAFGRARDALLVMVNLPLALIGGVAGVFLAGGVLSVASMIGFITLFGIATRNGIMLVSHIQHLMEVEGVTDFREAVERGAHERLVPILMTAMAAGLALIPLALGGGRVGQRDSDADGDRHPVRADDVDAAEHVRRADAVSAIRSRSPGAGRKVARWQSGEAYANRSLVVRRQRGALRLRHRVRHRRRARTARAGAPAGAAGPARSTPVATVKQIMDGIVDAGGRRGVRLGGTIVSAAGIEEKRRGPTRSGPRSATSAAALVESGNLLLMGDRAVDNGDWVKMSQAMTDAGKAALKAAEAKSADGILAAGEAINMTCDNCHRKISA